MDDDRILGERAMLAELRLDQSLIAIKGEAQALVTAKRLGRAGNHRRRAGVAPHRVDGNARSPSHGDANS